MLKFSHITKFSMLFQFMEYIYLWLVLSLMLIYPNDDEVANKDPLIVGGLPATVHALISYFLAT